MKDYYPIAPVPYGEECAQVGQPGYFRQAMAECRRFKALLEAAFPPPPGTSFKIKGFPHDFGEYHEVIVEFNDTNEASAEFAGMVEDGVPETWEELERMASSAQPPTPTKGDLVYDGIYDLDDLEEMLGASVFLATCPKCGCEQEVEPDASYPCPACKQGQLESPLRAMGMI